MLDGVGGRDKIQFIADRVVHLIIQGRAGMNDVAIGRNHVTVHARNQGGAGRRQVAAEFLLRRFGEPADGGDNLLNFRDWNSDHFINRIGKRPVQPRSQQGFLSLAHGFAETQNDGLFLGPDLEKAGPEKDHHQRHHHKFDDDKTAAQRLSQRLRTGVVGRHRLRRSRSGRVIVMVVLVAHGQWPGTLVRAPWNKSNGGIRSSKNKVER